MRTQLIHTMTVVDTVGGCKRSIPIYCTPVGLMVPRHDVVLALGLGCFAGVIMIYSDVTGIGPVVSLAELLEVCGAVDTAMSRRVQQGIQTILPALAITANIIALGRAL